MALTCRVAVDLDGAEQDVGGLHVAVQHPALVQGVQAGADLPDDVERLRDGQRLVLQPVGERALVGIRHDQERAGVLQLAGVVDRHDVGRLDLAQEAALLDEALPHVQVLGPVVGQHLDRDRAVELLVVGEPDGREGARPDATSHGVATEPGGDRHTCIMLQA